MCYVRYACACVCGILTKSLHWWYMCIFKHPDRKSDSNEFIFFVIATDAAATAAAAIASVVVVVKCKQ